jgi:hypothetical protein
MADITANVDAWSSTEESNSPSGSTSIGTGLDDNLRAVQAGIKVWASRFPYSSGELLNGRVTAAVGSSALTLAIKGKDGNDPSSTNKVYAAFRSSTASSSDWNIREITSALSVVVSSGSTLGHASGIVQHLFVYLIDNAGTVELAVSNLPPDYPGTFAGVRLISTTAEGGAGAADSATGIYSTTARSNVPWICVAMCKSNQVTAGTWAAAPTQIDMAPFTIPTFPISVHRNGSNQTISNATDTKIQFGTELYDPDSVFDNATNYRYQPNVAGYYNVSETIAFSDLGDQTSLLAIIKVNGSSRFACRNRQSNGSNTTIGVSISGIVLLNGTSDYIEFYVHQDSGGDKTMDGGAALTYGTAARVGA